MANSGALVAAMIRLGPMLLGLGWACAASAHDLATIAAARGADFRGEIASDNARRVADWVVASGDNGGLPFVIIDKIWAKVFVFGRDGGLSGATLALMGAARGDTSAPGIGKRALSTIRLQDRTTPAGRFVAALGHDLNHDVLWIDYQSSLSLHRVITGNPGDHRLQRLATTSVSDKRISFGCVNVPVLFYEDVVIKAFTGSRGIVYILPEIKTIEDIFPLPRLAANHSASDARQGR